jgi:glycine/D-amino acid oxidase-like deaminating enzyme
MQVEADVIIAGAGLAGLLTLQQLSAQHPDWTFILLEREARWGGRLRPTLRDEGSWSCGQQAVSSALFDHVVQAMGGEAAPWARPLRSIGVLAGQKVSEVAIRELMDASMARALGGAAAVKDWPQVAQLLRDGCVLGEEQSFSQAWKGDKKSAAVVVLEHLAHLWGLPELGPGSLRTLSAGARAMQEGLWTARWDQVWEPLLAELRNHDRLRLECRAQIMAAKQQDRLWTLATTRGTFTAPRLVVAQSPWEAIAWLPKELWPSKLLAITGKTKPVSLVILSAELANETPEQPDLLLVPAEETQVILSGRSICYQATLHYELTVQAPTVVKAVKRLKRARKKLETVRPDLMASGEHIALLPVGWAHTASPQEHRWFDKLELANLQDETLVFCGDAYGPHAEGDRNLIESVQTVITSFGKA